jgi:hypothetical protein
MKRGGRFKKLGSRNARTDIDYLTLERGMETNTFCLKTYSLQRIREGDVAYLLRTIDNTLR